MKDTLGYFSPSRKDNFLLEVKTSNVHGKGVFACEDIEAWSMTTMYPTHYICAGNTSGMQIATRYRNEVQTLGEGVNTYMMNFNPDLNVNTNPNYSIKISGDPTILNSGLGHMINDVGMINKLSSSQIEKYVKTQQKVNCFSVHIGHGVIVIMSIKPIKKGEELFLHYGMAYWLKGDTGNLI